MDVGQRIGNYEILAELARGGMGVVYRAYSQQSGEVALKVLLAGADANPQQRKRFHREVQALTRLRHPNIVAIRDAGEHRGCPYLVMDLVQGDSLQEHLARRGALTPRRAAEVTLSLARALEHAHRYDVLHRDVKPDNVLIRDGVPLLTDFGLARDLVGEQSKLSKTGTLLGSPGYWAPEQALGEVSTFGPALDIYGLGATLYASLTGHPPFVEASLMENVIATTERAPTPPSQLASVPPQLDAICLRCLEKRPENRYPSATELAAALEDYLAGVGAPSVRGARLFVSASALCGVLAVTTFSAGLFVHLRSPWTEVLLGSNAFFALVMLTAALVRWQRRGRTRSTIAGLLAGFLAFGVETLVLSEMIVPDDPVVVHVASSQEEALRSLRLVELQLVDVGDQDPTDFGARMKRIATGLRALEPDAVVLQSVYALRGYGVFHEVLQRELGMSSVYVRDGGSYRYQGREEGCMVLSRFPIRSVRILDLQPRKIIWDPHRAVFVTLKVGDRDVTVVSTELCKQVAEAQATYLASHLDPGQPLLVGAYLREEPIVAILTARGLRDVLPRRTGWRVLVADSPLWTVEDARFVLAPEDLPPLPAGQQEVHRPPGILVDLTLR